MPRDPVRSLSSATRSISKLSRGRPQAKRPLRRARAGKQDRAIAGERAVMKKDRVARRRPDAWQGLAGTKGGLAAEVRVAAGPHNLQ